ncbi:hypothetical protein [Vibrio parahaemolyticus]|uniref:hypothetical protein n=1 Tax=Vibrio parahaemolyticus TaxID=670 RepID=UPI001869B9BE|nr:hypothetical protein [Vibrio parahaemolyticus]MBE4462966.1 hypothetical protein [Vibrio parahaemolyticus]MDN4706436.1 hypothetical protein [Vibrio parahaemolyticus]MDN4714348.1 hypothetical protein [Vibrio parahaemolyticus]MDN4718220.1 hypothetical protein [Vibrio parahaemolyticus]MDN4721146.1 hypothetical protein [Vibrio parahaemolyticus]
MKQFIAIALSLLFTMVVNAESTLDFSGVDTRGKALELVKQGELFEVLLLPIELGGKEEPKNIVFVPADIPEAHEKNTENVLHFVKKKLSNSLEVQPIYKGNSFVPSQVKMIGKHSVENRNFIMVTNIW